MWRKKQLQRLYDCIIYYEPKIYEALKLDLGKSMTEAYLTEVSFVLSEIKTALKNLSKWNKPKRVRCTRTVIGSSSKIYRQPYGKVLILAPFNYPFHLSLVPMASALAAGNCVVLKPSELVSRTEDVIAKMINRNFDSGYCHVVCGGAKKARQLIYSDFDYIFFTGSYNVGKKVYEAAARKMIPVTLELGGKSPCIIDKSADIEKAAKRIVWGKFLNSGQTCVAPDYLLVQDCVKKPLIKKMSFYIKKFYTDRPVECSYYPKIVNEKHFDRLKNMLSGCDILIGGRFDRKLLKIEPTVVQNAAPENLLMREEIFGPVLPVVEFHCIDEIFSRIEMYGKPLAVYLFTKNKKIERNILKYVSFGGGCINDTVMHLCNYNLPFGGVGASGIGCYHGKAGFDTFSHSKSVM